MLVLHALLVIFLVCVFLFVSVRPRRIEDVREPDGVQKIGQETQELGDDIIINKWRQVLTPT